MSDQRGFPDGARTTPVPDLFFSRDLPTLDDPVQLKLALHVLWRIHRRPHGSPPAQRTRDLVADPALRRGLAALGVPEPDLPGTTREALRALAARGLLLRAVVGAADGPETWWMIDDHLGRRTLARLRDDGRLVEALPGGGGRERSAEESLDATVRDAATAGLDALAPVGTGTPAPPERPNIFVLYEEHIGLLSPLVAESLQEAANTYPPDWISDAFRAAAEANVRKWAYIRAILERWAKEGRGDKAFGNQRSARTGGDGAHDEIDRRRAGRQRADQGRETKKPKDPWDAFVRR